MIRYWELHPRALGRVTVLLRPRGRKVTQRARPAILHFSAMPPQPEQRRRRPRDTCACACACDVCGV
eukprot:1752496-Prymnesium_polylepis.1